MYGLSAVWCAGHLILIRSVLNFHLQTFELITGHWLFKPKAGDVWQREDDHLAQMMELTGEKFSTRLLERSRLRNHYFDDAGEHVHGYAESVVLHKKSRTGNLLRIDELWALPLEKAIAEYNVLAEDQIESVAAFIRACIRIDPAERASAGELQLHNWLAFAFTCS
jgi:serine/threonine-protein kinase SRPK3